MSAITIFLWIPLTLLLIGIAVITFVYPEKKKVVEQKIGDFFQIFFPIDWRNQIDLIEKSTIKALMKQSTVSQILSLRAYRKITKNIGIYELASGRKGIGFEIDCLTYTSDETTSAIRKAILETGIEDLVVQVVTYASDNVEEFIERAESCSNASRLNIDHPKELEVIRQERIDKTQTWSKTSMHDPTYTVFKARNIVNMIAIIFPSSTELSKISSIANEIRGKLSQANLSPRNLDPSKIIQLYSEILKESSVRGIEYDPFSEMNLQLAKGSRIRFEPDKGDIRIGDGTFARVFTTQQFPQHTNSVEIANAFFAISGGLNNPLPSKFILTTTIHVEDQDALKDKILKKAQFNKVKAGDEESEKKSTKIAKVRQESAGIIHAIEQKEERPYNGMWSLVIFEDSLEELENRAGRIKSAFDKIAIGGWKIKEEQFGGIAFLSMLYSLPFQFDLQAKAALNRYSLLFSSNIQAILPTIGSFRGFPKPIIKFFDRTGQCVGIDLWGSSTNYNACIIGDSGTGKSFLSNTIQASNLQAGVRTFIIDKGNSYLGFCNAIGGEYITFGIDPATGEEKDICLNFFTNVSVERVNASDILEGKLFFGVLEIDGARVGKDGVVELIDKEDLEQIVPIVCLMANIDTDKKDLETKQTISFIEIALQVAFLRMGRNAGMQDVIKALKEQEIGYKKAGTDGINQVILGSLMLALEAYGSETGRYYRYFNGSYNIDMSKDFIVLECDDLVSKGMELYNVVIMSAILQNTREMYADKNGERQRIIVVDEATPLLKNLATAKFLEDLARRVRKHNGALMIITQKTEDFNANASGRAIWGNSAHEFCLMMDSSEIENAYSENGLLKGKSSFVKDIAKTIRNNKPHYSEVLYFYGDRATPLVLKVGGIEYAMFSSDAKDKQKIEEYRKIYSISLPDARRLFGYKMDGMSEDEAYKKVKQGDQTSTNRYWLNNMRKVLNNNSVFADFKVYVDDEKVPVSVRGETTIQIDGGETYYLKQFEKIADENGYTAPIFEGFLNFIKEESPENVMIKIPNKVIGEAILEKIREKIKDAEITLALSMGDCTRNKATIGAFSEKAKEQGFFILLEEVDPERADLGLIDVIRPDYISLKRSEKEKYFIQLFKDDYSFIKSDVETLDDFESSVENGYVLFSGRYFERLEQR